MRAPVGSIVLLVLAAVLYAAMLSCLVDAPNSDAFGRGLALAYGAILGTALWIVLAVLLIVAAVNGRMPVWAILGAGGPGAAVVRRHVVRRRRLCPGRCFGDLGAGPVAAAPGALRAVGAAAGAARHLSRRADRRGAGRRHRLPHRGAPGRHDARRAARSGARRPPRGGRQGAGGAEGAGATGGARPRGSAVRKPRSGLAARELSHLSVEHGLRRAGAGRHPAGQEPPGRRGRAAAAGPPRRSAGLWRSSTSRPRRRFARPMARRWPAPPARSPGRGRIIS